MMKSGRGRPPAAENKVDTLITIPNQRLLSIGGKHMTIKDAFLKADEVLLYAVRSISDLIISSGHVKSTSPM